MSQILLVEDNPAHAEIIQRMISLHAPDLRVSHVSDGAEALEYLLSREESSLPDLILLDIRLPRMDGHQVLRRIRQEETIRSIPVIMLSTSSTQDDVVSALDREAVDYLVKPFSEAHVKSILRALGK